MTDEFHPIGEDEFSSLPDGQKLQLAGAWHQTIVEACRSLIGEMLGTGIEELDKFNTAAAANNQPLRHPNTIMVLVMHVDDVMVPEEFKHKWESANLEYGVLAVDRIAWTGGPGAPAWPRKHPYKKAMKDLAKDPPNGKLWIAVFAGGVATIGQLGEEAPVMANPAEVEGSGELSSDSNALPSAASSGDSSESAHSPTPPPDPPTS